MFCVVNVLQRRYIDRKTVRKIAHAASARRFARNKKVVQNARIQKRGCIESLREETYLSYSFIYIFSGSSRETLGADLRRNYIPRVWERNGGDTFAKRKRKVRWHARRRHAAVFNQWWRNGGCWPTSQPTSQPSNPNESWWLGDRSAAIRRQDRRLPSKL